jgi:mannose-6-phosphate isomerase-like protein (cupin superfamily)
MSQVRTDRRVATLSHDLAGRPEFTLDAIGAVAATLDPKDMERHAADIPVLHASGAVRRLQQSFAEIVDLDAPTPWWIMLAGALGQTAPYDALAADLAAPWSQPTIEAEGGPVGPRFVTIFVSSPRSVVPHHIDYQHNVLVQLAGTKEVTIGTIPDAAVEQCVTSANRNMLVPPETTETFVLGPGDGLYIPPRTPHSVIGSQGISISFSSMWNTAWCETERKACYWNAWLRRHGITPHAPSGGRMVDRVKASTADRHGRKARRRTAT